MEGLAVKIANDLRHEGIAREQSGMEKKLYFIKVKEITTRAVR